MTDVRWTKNPLPRQYPARMPDNIVATSRLVVDSITCGGMFLLASATWYKSPRGNRVYCVMYVNSAAKYNSGIGIAEGYGYNTIDAAFADAMRDAGFQFFGKNLNPERMLKAIAEHYGFKKYIVV